jgi:cbb3-type cytochrome oxidase subunit 1
MGRNLATEMAPPFILVAHFFIAGAIFFTISSLLLPMYADTIGGYFLSTKIAAFIHFYLLGFVMMVIFGAMYQLIPVVLEIPIFSKDFAYVQFYMFILGIALFCFGFWHEAYFEISTYGALLIYISIVIFAINIFLTYKNLKEWDIVAKFILVSNIFLLTGATLGLFLSLDLVYGFYGLIEPMVKMHIGLTIFGYVIMTILGVGMVLLPMFSLSHGFSDKAIHISFYTISAGLSLYIVGGLLHIQALQSLGAICIALSIVFGAYQMYKIFSTRVRKQNDFWAKNMVASFWSAIAAFVVLGFSTIQGDDRLFILFGYLLFFGFFIFFIVGHIYKILPFLVWYQRFSPLVGKTKVPMLNDMVKEKVADMQFWTTLLGFLVSTISIIANMPWVFKIGAYIMFIGTLMVIYNICFTLNFKAKEENAE